MRDTAKGKTPLAGFDPSRFVVLGEGLAAGLGNFSLHAGSQATSFPALTAAAMGVAFAQPLIQPPGLGDVASFAPQRPIVPDLQQSTVLVGGVPQRAPGNLSVPGLTLRQAFEARPLPPIVHRGNNLQTLINFILGMPELTRRPHPGPTQVEAARRQRPTLALVCLGYQEAVEAATTADTVALADVSRFAADFDRLLAALRGATLIVTTVPDPLDSAYFSNLESAARILKTEPRFLERHYGLAEDDLLTLHGLYEIGVQMMNRQVGPPATEPAIRGATAAGLRAGVDRLNAAIGEAARRHGALLFDLHGLVRDLAAEGLRVGRLLTTEYLGGLFLLNGLYPGATLHAAIAGALLRTLNATFGKAYAEPALPAIVANDANTECRLAPGPPATDVYLEPRKPSDLPPLPPIEPPPQEFPIQTIYPALQPGKDGCQPLVGVPAGGLSNPQQPIELPQGLEQTLDVRPEGSSIGDALRIVDCPDDRPFVPGFPPFGTCAQVFFGGEAVVSSRLRGKIHVKFSPPDEKRQSRFEIRHPGGLFGEDAVLQAPQMFRMGAQLNVVEDLPDLVSSGVVQLDSGVVTDFHYNVRNANTAILALLDANPNLPIPALTFPGPPNGGSTWLRFDPRDDGRLDVTLAANLFLPLGLEAGGEAIRIPLPFSNPHLQCASFVARGTTLHPRLHLTTREQPPVEDPGRVPADVPFNTVCEYTCFTRSTSFGDEFDLANPALGEATGQSHLLGRVRVQFGVPSGGTVPVIFSALPPGGLLDDAPLLPPFTPPGTSRGLSGFDVELSFREAVYPQTGLSNPDDPFNLAVGVLDLASGRILGELLFRGYVVQELFSELIQVEPCTPADSFLYQGPARFERGANGQTVLRFEGKVFLPYPPGFKFPSPGAGGRPPFVIGPDSKLDPFRWIQAMHQPRRFHGTLSGGESHAVSSIGQRFSYRYSIPCAGDDAGRASFRYTNHNQGGTFRLTTLSWVDAFNGLGSQVPAGQPDTVTFGGFGRWSLDRRDAPHQVSVQISTAADAPYVGIQVDGGVTSNVDTKPPFADSRP